MKLLKIFGLIEKAKQLKILVPVLSHIRLTNGHNFKLQFGEGQKILLKSFTASFKLNSPAKLILTLPSKEKLSNDVSIDVTLFAGTGFTQNPIKAWQGQTAKGGNLEFLADGESCIRIECDRVLSPNEYIDLTAYGHRPRRKLEGVIKNVCIK